MNAWMVAIESSRSKINHYDCVFHVVWFDLLFNVELEMNWLVMSVLCSFLIYFLFVIRLEEMIQLWKVNDINVWCLLTVMIKFYIANLKTLFQDQVTCKFWRVNVYDY